jgi:hypothetical protein
MIARREDLLSQLRASTSSLDAQFIGAFVSVFSYFSFLVTHSLELQLSILHAQDEWIACENYLATFFNSTSYTVSFTQQAVCTQNYNSDAFFTDSCCDWGRQEILYCPPQDVDLVVSQPQGLIANQTDQCQFPQCVAILSLPYIATKQSLLDTSIGIP